MKYTINKIDHFLQYFLDQPSPIYTMSSYLKFAYLSVLLSTMNFYASFQK